jgi:DNA invertase Pin-like site-specific DNA recombinase
MRIALYARVSTRDKRQDTENQLLQLRTYCQNHGYEILKEYVDEVTGSSASRKYFLGMMEAARHKEFDLLLFWALDRFTREGVLATLNYLNQLNDYKVGWRSYTEQYLDSSGMFKDAIIAILASIAKQEHVRIQERVLAGLDRVKKQGKILGPPRKIFDREKVRQLRAEGKSLGEIAKAVGVGKDSIRGVLSV